MQPIEERSSQFFRAHLRAWRGPPVADSAQLAPTRISLSAGFQQLVPRIEPPPSKGVVQMAQTKSRSSARQGANSRSGSTSQRSSKPKSARGNSSSARGNSGSARSKARSARSKARSTSNRSRSTRSRSRQSQARRNGQGTAQKVQQTVQRKARDAEHSVADAASSTGKAVGNVASKARGPALATGAAAAGVAGGLLIAHRRSRAKRLGIVPVPEGPR